MEIPFTIYICNENESTLLFTNVMNLYNFISVVTHEPMFRVNLNIRVNRAASVIRVVI